MRLKLLGTLVTITLLLTYGLSSAAPILETEPNDSPAQADSLMPGIELQGGITPSGDVDFFSVPGVNVTWGFIALLETDSASTSQDGVLTALGSDGSTVLSTDQGSWVHGSGIALQNFADGSATHYLKVEESGGDATMSDYILRYYRTIVNTKPEVEPNETRSTATPSSYTMDGYLATNSDVDCFAFQAIAGESFLFAVNADPENDGSPANLQLQIFNPSDLQIASADHSGAGGDEFLEIDSIPGTGVYAYCVSLSSGSAGASATYHAGIVRNGYLYTSTWDDTVTWTNPPADGVAFAGDTLTFEMYVANSSLVDLPDDIDLLATFDPACLSFVNASVTPTNTSSGRLEWYGLLPDGLDVGESFTIDVDMQAERACHDDFHQSTLVRYFFSGRGDDAPYQIYGLYLPLIMK